MHKKNIMLRLIFKRNFSAKTLQFKVFSAETPEKNRSLVESIAESNDQRAFFAWHPKKEFPYEFTKSIPTAKQQITNSLIKDEILEKALKAYRHEYPDLVREKLSKLTFTTKHRWFPRSRDKKAKKTEMDRPYL